MHLAFAHPWFLLLLLALPAVAWWRARRGKDAAFLYSSVELARGVANIGRSGASRHQGCGSGCGQTEAAVSDEELTRHLA